MSWLLDPVIRYCAFCPAEWACSTEGEAEKKKAQHEHLRHAQPLPQQEVTGADWQAQALDAVRQVAARGQDFRIFDALAEFGLQSPPDAQHRVGRFTALVHDLGVAHKVRSEPSTRPGTKSSDAGVWNRDPARCTRPNCRVRAGAA